MTSFLIVIVIAFGILLLRQAFKTTSRQTNFQVTQVKGLLEYTCKNCKTATRLKHPDIIHTGFNETGFMYCKDCGKVITWSCYDKQYEKLIGQRTVPWALTDNQKNLIEKSAINCNCGGQFSFSAKPRC